MFDRGGQSAAQGVECRACARSFRRPGDLKRHKCRVEREKPVEKQKGSVQCGSAHPIRAN